MQDALEPGEALSRGVAIRLMCLIYTVIHIYLCSGYPSLRCIDDLPVHPWLHCQGCRNTFVKLEAISQRGAQLYPAGPYGPLMYALVTPADMAGFMSAVTHEAIIGDKKNMAPNQVLSVLELLGESGYDLKTIRSAAKLPMPE